MGKFINGLACAGCPVGIAADVRLFLHEFGHALLWDHVDFAQLRLVPQRRRHAGGDRLRPRLAGARPLRDFPCSPLIDRRHDRDVAARLGLGRRADDTQYGSEQILSTTLFRVYRVTGGDDADIGDQRFAARYLTYLIVKAIGTLTATTTDPEVFVTALMDADNSTVNFEGHPAAPGTR